MISTRKKVSCGNQTEYLSGVSRHEQERGIITLPTWYSPVLPSLRTSANSDLYDVTHVALLKL